MCSNPGQFQLNTHLQTRYKPDSHTICMQAGQETRPKSHAIHSSLIQYRAAEDHANTFSSIYANPRACWHTHSYTHTRELHGCSRMRQWVCSAMKSEAQTELTQPRSVQLSPLTRVGFFAARCMLSARSPARVASSFFRYGCCCSESCGALCCMWLYWAIGAWLPFMHIYVGNVILRSNRCVKILLLELDAGANVFEIFSIY